MSDLALTPKLVLLPAIDVADGQAVEPDARVTGIPSTKGAL